MHYYMLDQNLMPHRCSPERGFVEYFTWHDSMPAEGAWYIRKTGVGFSVAADDVLPGVRVSTVYLGMDHGFGGEPVLWETMIFCDDKDSPADCWQERYTSHAAAVERHKMLCRFIASEGLDALTDKASP